MVLHLNGSDERTQKVAAAELGDAFIDLAFDGEGCRVAQDALEFADKYVKVQLALKLSGHIMEAIDSPFANYVVQKVIEVLSPSDVKFILDELAPSVIKVAQHPYGVRVLCRLVEHCPPQMIEASVLEVASNAAYLCGRKFGAYIVQHVLEYGTSEQRRMVVRALAGNALEYCRHRSSSRVIQQAILRLEAVERSELVQALSRDEDALLKLSDNRHAQGVIEALFELPGEESDMVQMAFDTPNQ